MLVFVQSCSVFCVWWLCSACACAHALSAMMMFMMMFRVCVPVPLLSVAWLSCGFSLVVSLTFVFCFAWCVVRSQFCLGLIVASKQGCHLCLLIALCFFFSFFFCLYRVYVHRHVFVHVHFDFDHN